MPAKKLKRENFRKLEHREWHEIHASVNRLAELVARKNYGRRIVYSDEQIIELFSAREQLARLVRGADFYLDRLKERFRR